MYDDKCTVTFRIGGRDRDKMTTGGRKSQLNRFKIIKNRKFLYSGIETTPTSKHKTEFSRAFKTNIPRVTFRERSPIGHTMTIALRNAVLWRCSRQAIKLLSTISTLCLWFHSVTNKWIVIKSIAALQCTEQKSLIPLIPVTERNRRQPGFDNDTGLQRRIGPSISHHRRTMTDHCCGDLRHSVACKWLSCRTEQTVRHPRFQRMQSLLVINLCLNGRAADDCDIVCGIDRTARQTATVNDKARNELRWPLSRRWVTQ